MRVLIKGGMVVQQTGVTQQDILIQDDRIVRIDRDISASNVRVYDAEGGYVLPGGIDMHVHFREPGLTHKGSIYTESRAAVAGGVTSYIDMPNTSPPTTNMACLAEKYALAAESSACNYAFYLGATQDNIAVIAALSTADTCGIKIFMGSSTGDLLVDDPAVLERIFAATPLLILTHCEDEALIRHVDASDGFVAADHPTLRPREGCIASTRLALSLAERTGARLHVLHVTTSEEIDLFAPYADKDQISCEVCPQHWLFSDRDYAKWGNFLKVNPAIKTAEDSAALWAAIQAGTVSLIGSDHAPHTQAEKNEPYSGSPSGMPMVQHRMYVLLEAALRGEITLPDVVRLCSHAPALRCGIRERGVLAEGYFADIAVFTRVAPATVPVQYACGWSVLEDRLFSTRCTYTWVNGRLVWEKGKHIAGIYGQRLAFC